MSAVCGAFPHMRLKSGLSMLVDLRRWFRATRRVVQRVGHMPSRLASVVSPRTYLYTRQREMLATVGHGGVCREHMDLCVEGYPRSANTFTVDMIKGSNPRLVIAHHTHDVDNIRLALLFRIPTLVVIRNPLDAVTSHSVYFDAQSVGQGVVEWINLALSGFPKRVSYDSNMN